MSYIIIDMPGGLRLVDQHVAHERVLYDRSWQRIETAAPATQGLLTPILYERGAAETAVLESHLDELRAVGFEIERFSGNTFAIPALPPALGRNDLHGSLPTLTAALLDARDSHRR